jgi:hypothetical protein
VVRGPRVIKIGRLDMTRSARCGAGKYIAVAGSDELLDCIGCVVGKYIDVTGSDELSDCIDCWLGK